MVSVRKATNEDTSDILACLSAAFAEYRDSYTLGAFADTVLTPETIARRLQKMTIFVAIEESGDIVGTVACSLVGPEEGHIRGMAVFPASQGTGVATRLLLRAESHFREANCKRITLDTTAPRAGDTVLRKVWLRAIGEDPGLLWDAAHRIRQIHLIAPFAPSDIP